MNNSVVFFLTFLRYRHHKMPPSVYIASERESAAAVGHKAIHRHSREADVFKNRAKSVAYYDAKSELDKISGEGDYIVIFFLRHFGIVRMIKFSRNGISFNHSPARTFAGRSGLRRICFDKHHAAIPFIIGRRRLHRAGFVRHAVENQSAFLQAIFCVGRRGDTVQRGQAAVCDRL